MLELPHSQWPDLIQGVAYPGGEDRSNDRFADPIRGRVRGDEILIATGARTVCFIERAGRAVALDAEGRIAAATSTGGVFGKLEGRVGDTPLIGSGTWADELVGASCTGLGEYFILAGGAQDVASRVAWNRSRNQKLLRVSLMLGDGAVESEEVWSSSAAE